jgi:hypothetical protein
LTVSFAASGVIGVAAFFTPLAPVVVTAAAVAGATSALYGAGRYKIHVYTRFFNKL